MAKKAAKQQTDLGTEGRILEAARNVFTRKGYAATRTRDIAEEAGINLALLNYYFRSKEKLFEVVMVEKIQTLFGVLAPVLNESNTTLDAKIERAADMYITGLLANPDLPLFVLNELKNNPERFIAQVHAGELLKNSEFVKQLKEARPDVHPFQLLSSILGMLIFPFIARPIFQQAGGVPDDAYNRLLEQRKTLVPELVKKMLKP